MRNLVCAFVGVAALGVAACAQEPTASAHVQTLRVGYQATSEVSKVMSDLLFADRLVTIDWRGRPALQLASDYRWKDQGKTLELTLRPDVKFHDGTPISAEAAAESIRNYAAKPSNARRFTFLAGVEAAEGGRVLIRLKQPDAFILEAVAGAPIVDPANADNGSGPFKRVKHEPTIEGIRYDHYYRGIPGIERVQITTYDTPRKAWVAMMNAEVDVVPEVNSDSVEFLVGTTRFETYPSMRPFYIPLVFNVRQAVLKNAEVRRALADAINRDEIVQRALRGHGQIAEDPIWPFHWAYATSSHRRQYNPAAAALRLEAAGFPIRPNKDPERMPSRFQLRCLFWEKGPQYERIALLLQRQLAAIGVDLVLDPKPDEDSVQRGINSGAFDTYLYHLASGKSFDYTYAFWHSDANGVGQIQNTGYTGANDILERLRAAQGDAEVRVAVADLRQRFYEDVPAAFIAWSEVTRAVDARFDVGDPLDPEMLANLWRWKVRSAQRRTQ